MKNPYPNQEKTHERQGGGQTPASGEKHNSKKARTIPGDRRYAGAENAPLENSPGRVNDDANGAE